ncbi:MAG: DUF4147 domain-containing protein [Halobacteria archaeon]|nr:DUF4147 domain-containing protein [Halobacteria archaeon]
MVEFEREYETGFPGQVCVEAVKAGIEAVSPEKVVETNLEFDGDSLSVGEDGVSLDVSGFERLLVVGGGKGSSVLAREIVERLGGVDGGVVVDSEPVDVPAVETVKGSHPVPDETSVEGATKVVETAREAAADDLVVFVVTGGGSSLMTAPADGIQLKDLRRTNRLLLESGASIDEINSVRKHLSEIKGGRLARELDPARTVSVIVSDVVGDDTSVIASGPTSPDASTYSDAVKTLREYGIYDECPDAVVRRLTQGVEGEWDETPSYGDICFEKVDNVVVANTFDAVDAAREHVENRGYETVVLSSLIESESRDVGEFHASVLRECVRTGNPVEPPCAVISGGETTVEVTGDGEGGPNQEFVLSCLLSLYENGVGGSDGVEISVGAVDTDGIDGVGGAAGAVGSTETVDDPEKAAAALEENSSYSFFDERDGLLVTGETSTNVSDLRVMVIRP